MIILTRLGGHQVAVNPDLIERAEATPDTVITLVDGHKLVVVDPVDDVVAAVRTWRASIAAEAHAMTRTGDAGFHRRVDRTVHAAAGTTCESERDDDDVAVHSALGASLARVLRLPSREE